MNVEQEHRKIISISVFIAFFLALIFVATYAIIQNLSYNTENVIASLGSRPVFTSTATNSIVMTDIPYIAETVASEFELANASDNLSLLLSTNFNINTSCTYDLVWEWDVVDNAANGYHKTIGATKEYTVSGTSSDGLYFGEVQLNDYNANNLKTTLVSGLTLFAYSNVMTNRSWEITTHFYKTQAIQSDHRGKTYSGKVYVDNVLCSQLKYWHGLGNHLTFPATAGTLQNTGLATGHNVYVAQNSTNYFVCGTATSYSNTEICLSQPFSQYGVLDHVATDNYTTEEQASLKEALLKVYSDNGINITASDCETSSSNASCTAGNIDIMVNRSGDVLIREVNERIYCSMNTNGKARCRSY